MKTIFKLSITFLMLWFFCGCAAMGGMTESASYDEEMMYDEPVPTENVKMELGDYSVEGNDMTSGFEDSSPDTQTTSTVPEQRKRIYTGYINLMVNEVKQAKDDIIEIAEQSGGYVEQIVEYAVIIRVPAELFFEVFEILLDYDDVIDKSLETYDVTESYTDLAARLEISQKTRERLYNLLERTDNVREKLRILQEIRRLTEEIELINSTLEVLANQISYSRITIDLSPRFQEEQYSRQEIPFPWIAALNPLYNSLDTSIQNINFELGDNFAVFDREKNFIAESSDGTVVRVSKTDNNPEGDNSFWQKALSYHLEPFYKNAEEFDSGNMKSVLFESKDSTPFYYLVSVYVKENNLYVLEVFFPKEESLNTNIDSIKNSIRSFEIK
jgi:hypothetical protein